LESKQRHFGTGPKPSKIWTIKTAALPFGITTTRLSELALARP
jgi:hypothetical protein